MENSLAEQINKVIFAAFKTKNVTIHDFADGIFLCRLKAYIRKYSEDIRLFNTRSCHLQVVVSGVLGRTYGFEQPFFLFAQNSKRMTKNVNLRVNANNSTVNSTSGHDTATRHPILSITRYDADDLMQTTLRLGGEEALERLGLLVRHPHEDFAAEQAMRSLLNYYANVRYLCARLRGVILHAEAEGAGKIRRKGNGIER